MATVDQLELIKALKAEGWQRTGYGRAYQVFGRVGESFLVRVYRDAAANEVAIETLQANAGSSFTAAAVLRRLKLRRPLMPEELVHRMQGVVGSLARFDPHGRRGADELDLIHAESQSVMRAVEAWYPASTRSPK
jgi:hypothetical protein